MSEPVVEKEEEYVVAEESDSSDDELSKEDSSATNSILSDDDAIKTETDTNLEEALEDNLDDNAEEEIEPPEDTPSGTFNQPHKNIVIVDPEKRKTSHVINKTELTELTSIRASQIASNGTAFVDTTGLTDPIAMAQKEVNEGKCPMILRRKVGSVVALDGKLTEYVEYWDVNKMVKPFTY